MSAELEGLDELLALLDAQTVDASQNDTTSKSADDTASTASASSLPGALAADLFALLDEALLPGIVASNSPADTPQEKPKPADHQGKSKPVDLPSSLKQRRARSKTKYARPPHYDSNFARNQLRAELLALRDEAQELEQRLGVLRASKGNVAQKSVVSEKQQKICGKTGKADDWRKGVWQELAVRQIEDRTAAENENMKLKRMVETQKKLIAELKCLVFSRVAGKAMEKVPRAHTVTHPLLEAVHNFDPKLFEPLMDLVEEQYRNMDQVFEDDFESIHGPHKRINLMRGGHMRTDADGHLFFQLFGRKVFPFDVQTTGGAAWKRFSYTIRPSDGTIFTKIYDTPEDIVAEHFATDLRLGHASVVILCYQIKRIYRTMGRIAILWRSNVNAVEFMGKPLAGAEYTESGYFLIERPPSAPEGYAVLRTCYILAPNVPMRSLPQDSTTFALMDFVFKLMAAMIPGNHQVLENMLILEAARNVCDSNASK